MNADEFIDKFFSLNVDGAKIQAYLDDLARSDAAKPQALLQQQIDALQAEIATLQQDKSDLEIEIEHLNRVRLEGLLAFLPIFFRDFWATVRPDELAMMCGRIAPPIVPSPYLEPSVETVRFMKIRFKTLAAAEREPILRFCRSLQHRLGIRAEMREFFSQSF